MKTKKYLFIDKRENNHEYTLHVSDVDQGTKYEIYYSNSGVWTEHTKGTLAFSMVDDGNGWILDGKYKKLDYSQCEYFRIILEFANSTSHMPNKYSVMEEVELMEI